MILANKWVPADGLTLEPNALRAATCTSGCLALTAGPGAGKTEMLAQRADFLLRTNTCPYPRRILAISFKLDASRNLKERVQKRCGHSLASRFDSYTFHAFAKHLIDRFRQLLTGNEALDADYTIGTHRVMRTQITFQDMVPFGLQILRTSDMARNVVRQSYTDVFMDEFQDCTGDQYDLLKEAFLGTDVRLTAVGDTKQKIMSFAGAVEGIFSDYVQDFSAVPLNMYQNFRSDPVIRRMHNAMVKVMDEDAAVSDDDIVGDEGTIRVLAFDDAAAEAESLSEMIKGWIENDGVAPSEIAVLGAKTPEAYAEELGRLLEVKGILLRNEQAVQDFYTEPVVQIISNFLLVTYGKREPDAWSRLSDVLDFLTEDSPSKQRSLQGVFDAQVAGEVELSEVSLRTQVSVFLAFVGDDYIRSLSPDYENGERPAKLVEQFYQEVGQHSKTPDELIDYLHSMAQSNAVRLLSIHKCKGLEFDKVIILAVENQMFWGKREEERCAFFVGISRAKHELILTYCGRRTQPSNSRRWDIIRSPQEEFLGYADGLTLD